jgi:TonB family protein
MKKQTAFLVFLLLAFYVSAQGNFRVVQQQQAHYPAGMQAFQDYFNKNMSYSDEAYDNRVYGEVMLSFDVSADSIVSNIILLQGKGFGIDEEVVRLLEDLKFAPALANDIQVRSNVILSVFVKAIREPVLQFENH